MGTNSSANPAGQPASEAPSGPSNLGAERARLEEALRGEAPWHLWGPYLAERAWGTVREDYSADGDAWAYFPFEQAASRAYRWGEDGMGGICDEDQLICMALALWNGQDPILKERLFGLTNAQGNHGEDAKECWWHLDATPTSSWLQWRYHYPQSRFPYEELVAENARRSRLGPEYILWLIEATNMGRGTAYLDLLPTVWFRNRWSWQPGTSKPCVAAVPSGNPGNSASPHDGTGTAACLSISEERRGRFELVGGFGVCGQSGTPVRPELLFTDNETNSAKLWGTEGPRYTKDAIAEHVLNGPGPVNPALSGTKAALRYHFEVPPGMTASVRLRFGRQSGDLGAGFDAVLAARKAEADEFYARLAPAGASPEEARVLRQAAAGMLWCKQFYHYDVKRWLDGDPGQPPPPPQRREGRNSRWLHLFNHEVISMPDSWEYPWYAAWDLAFHAVALAHLDPAYAKYQLLLLCREWYMHPNGQLPAYEWDFSDVNPPVQAWAAMAVWRTDARQRAARGLPPDNEFLEKVFHKLLLNFTWWVNREDAEGNNLFEGGFLGLDNIGLFDRSHGLPVPGVLEQSDGTAWMAMYCVSMLEMALRLCSSDRTYEDIAIKFYEHFAYISMAVHTSAIWDDDDGFFYDVLHYPDGSSLPLKVRSASGLVPLFAVTTLHPDLSSRLPGLMRHIERFGEARPALAAYTAHTRDPGAGGRLLMSIVDKQALVRVLRYVLDPEELLSPYGVRSLSARYRDHPFTVQLGDHSYSIDYEPAESTTPMFGGNSNWRGPVWFPINYLLIEALRRYDRYFGPALRLECPTGSGNYMTLAQIASELSRRLISLFLPGASGRRPAHGSNPLVADGPAWRDLIWFHEYFHGDNGAGLGASHQTGWTGLVLHLIADGRTER